jgi:hypothetical protein
LGSGRPSLPAAEAVDRVPDDTLEGLNEAPRRGFVLFGKGRVADDVGEPDGGQMVRKRAHGPHEKGRRTCVDDDTLGGTSEYDVPDDHPRVLPSPHGRKPSRGLTEPVAPGDSWPLVKRTLLILFGILTVLAILVAAAAWFLGPRLRYERRVEVHPATILEIDLEGRVVERAPPDLLSAEFEGADHQLYDLTRALERAVTDDRIEGIVLEVGDPGYGWAMAEELRSRLARVREAGKFVYAFTSLTNELGYYVAVEADSVFVLPGSGLELNGFRVETRPRSKRSAFTSPPPTCSAAPA